MRRDTTLVALLMGLATLLPSVGASWGAYGSLEPDTQADVAGGFMWRDEPDPLGCVPPTEEEPSPENPCHLNRVYFNVFQGAYRRGPSPNSAMLGGRVELPGQVSFSAWLGVWVDCNHDGYIGMADGALREYRDFEADAAGTPVDLALCPPLDEEDEANQGKVRNGQGWITEMIYIGPPENEEPIYVFDARYVRDPAVRVWGDHGGPEPVEATPCTEDDQVFLREGQAESTGGVLQHAACMDGHAVRNGYELASFTDPTGTLAGQENPWTSLGPGGGADVALLGSEQACPDDGPQPCEGNHAIVSGTQDCSREPRVPLSAGSQRVEDPTSPGDYYTVTLPSDRGVRYEGVPTVNPDGNVPATVNETVEESPLDDCDSSNDYGHDVYGPAQGDAGVTTLVSSGPKRSADLVFVYSHDSRVPCGGVQGRLCAAPKDLGVPAVTGLGSSIVEVALVAVETNTWYAAAETSPSSARFTETRDDDPPALDPAPQDVWTFYARYSAPNAEGPHEGDGAYGAEFCPAINDDAEPANGWDCAPNRWNIASDGSKLNNPEPGWPYQVRDVDCFDGTLVSRRSEQNPTGRDLGAHAAAGVTDEDAPCA